MDLLKEESKRALEDLKNTTTEYYNEEVTVWEEEVVYYEPYLYDPYYVSPCWLWVGLLLL